MKVFKFGGTSVGSVDAITAVRDIVKDGSKSDQLVVVLSAFGGVTNQLVLSAEKAADGQKAYEEILAEIRTRHHDAIAALIPETRSKSTLMKVDSLLDDLAALLKGVYLLKDLSLKSYDQILGHGELLSCTVISQYFESCDLPNYLADPREMIITDDSFGSANVDFEETNSRIKQYLNKVSFPVICPGFVSATIEGKTTTLGRGGSDYSAAIIAAASGAEALEIWTDVDGMMTADPRLVSSAHSIQQLSFQEAMELSHFGAKVLYPPTIQPVLGKKIPIHIKNTFNPTSEGTTIHDMTSVKPSGQLVRGLSSVKNIALLNLTGSGMVGIPKFSSRLFKALSEAKVNVIIITQASSEHSICVGVDGGDIEASRHAINEEFKYEISLHQVDPLEVVENLGIVALVGENMRDHVGISGQMFVALGENGINIKAIAQGSSERNITVVIENKNLKKALNVLHESFFLSEKKRVNLFMIGVGNVGGTLIDQIGNQYDYLFENENIDLRIIGVANSRKMYFDADGLDYKNFKATLETDGTEMYPERFIDTISEMNLRNSVFIDNTADEGIAQLYNGILRKNIAIVTPNKIACASSTKYYQQLKQTSREYRTKFYYETNVGAGLPIISTLGDLIKSGDKIHKIQAVLSGSLNYIFNTFNEDTTFLKVVQSASEEGYTEPDPRIDLSGSDVMRKILILVRESGLQLEMEDIQNKGFVPEECMNEDSVEAFMESLERHESTFQDMCSQAKAHKTKLKYVAQFDKGVASVGLEEVSEDHPFYHLEGKDNIVLFYTNRYSEQPLVIKGAGAGAAVTASGIFADIMKIANS